MIKDDTWVKNVQNAIVSFCVNFSQCMKQVFAEQLVRNSFEYQVHTSFGFGLLMLAAL